MPPESHSKGVLIPYTPPPPHSERGADGESISLSLSLYILHSLFCSGTLGLPPRQAAAPFGVGGGGSNNHQIEGGGENPALRISLYEIIKTISQISTSNNRKHDYTKELFIGTFRKFGVNSNSMPQKVVPTNKV